MRPWLYLPPGVSYKISPFFIQLYGKFFGSREFLWSPLKWRGLSFKNPLGLAAGVDKNGKNIKGWWSFGPSFIEVGTVTPKPQFRNKGEVLDHDKKKKSLWNHLGFPNQGSLALSLRLQKEKKPYFTPLFVSIGRNRWTQNKDVVEDLIECVKSLKDLADAFVINVSSPNTKGLRNLLNLEDLGSFLNSFFFSYKKIFFNEKSEKAPLEDKKKIPPVLIKLSPDHKEKEFEDILNITYEEGVDGWVVTNSSLRGSSHFDSHLKFPAFGGVSGQLIKDLSKNRLKQTVYFLKNKMEKENKGEKKIIISSGGILSEEDVFERLEMGADLVQVYSALIFNGPSFFKKVFKKWCLKTR